MKPVVLNAQSKELASYIKSIENLDNKNSLVILKKLNKMFNEIVEFLEKNQ